MECWVNPAAAGVPSTSLLFSSGPNALGGPFAIGYTSGSLYPCINFNGIPHIGTIQTPIGTWAHLAMVRQGSTVTLYVNGSSAVTLANTTTTCPANTIYLGGVDSSTMYQGSIAGARISKCARYTANFVSPTTPFLTTTAVIYDPFYQCTSFQTGFENNLTTTVDTSGNNTQFGTPVGVAQNTSTIKVGSDSAYFGGSGLSLGSATSAALVISGDCTIEMWFNVSSAPPSNGSYIISNNNTSGGNTFLCVNGSGGSATISGAIGGTAFTTFSYTVNIGTWYHIALVRQGSVVTIYMNGVAQSTTTMTNNLTAVGLTLGNQTLGATNSCWFTGYEDQVRITKAARYAANFNAPTSPFLTVGAV